MRSGEEEDYHEEAENELAMALGMAMSASSEYTPPVEGENGGYGGGYNDNGGGEGGSGGRDEDSQLYMGSSGGTTLRGKGKGVLRGARRQPGEDDEMT